MELLTVKYNENGSIAEIEQLDCCICGGDHRAEECDTPYYPANADFEKEMMEL